MIKRKWEFKFDVLKPWNWWKNRERPKKEPKYEWVYECGCLAKGCTDEPYCPIHGLKLTFREKGKMT